MDQKIDWLIHLVANGACDECGEVETDFLPYMCNAHTHGLERYGHFGFPNGTFFADGRDWTNPQYFGAKSSVWRTLPVWRYGFRNL